MSEASNPLGSILIAHRAIASVAYQAACSSYGVVGLAPKNIARGLANVIVKDPTLGVDIEYDEENISINLYIIVEYGTRISSITSSIADNVRYQVEKAIGIPVNEVNIHVRGIRVSDTD